MTQVSDMLSLYMDDVPEWASFITTDSHGYVKAWEKEPKVTPGGLFYSLGRMIVLAKPSYGPEVMSVRNWREAASPAAGSRTHSGKAG